MAMKMAKFLPVILKKWLFLDIHNLFGGHLKFIACGGAPLGKRLGENWFDVGLPVIEGYGATEVTAIATVNNFSSPKFGTAGKPIPGVEIKIDKNGEIFIKSNSVSGGYFNNTRRTKKLFAKGWYRTGDIGELDKDGNLCIKGREVFKIVLPNGEKVFAEDIETRILQDSRVKEACVVAKITPNGDKIHAYFILNGGVDDELRTIVADINEHLDSKQQILSFDLWPMEDFPRTTTLKIDRKSVFLTANREGDNERAKNEKPENPYNIQSILDILSRVSGIERNGISDSDRLAVDLGIDSLSRVEIVALTEEYLGVILDERKITAKTTCLLYTSPSPRDS